jgi:hypothetical protein
VAGGMAEGEIKAVICRSFPLPETARAHALLEGAHVAGKLLLEVNPARLDVDASRCAIARAEGAQVMAHKASWR